MLQYVEQGGEKYLPFTKRKVLQWHDEMRRSGMRTLSRIILVDDNSTTIYVSILALQNDQWVDKIRITGGVEYKYIALVNAPSPETDLLLPAVTSGGVVWGPQVAWWGQAGGSVALYGSITSQYSYTDEYGVSDTVELGSYSAAGTGIQSLGTGHSQGFGYDVSGGTFLDTYQGLPRYINFTDGVYVTGDMLGLPGVNAEYEAALARYAAAMAALYLSGTTSLVEQLSGEAPLDAALHDAVYDAHPAHPVTDERIADEEVVDFYYASTESASQVWGAFGVPPSNDPVGDEALYLIPIMRVRYDKDAERFTAAEPAEPAVLRDPVRDGDMVTWDWANLPDTVRLARPADAYEGWSGNVVAVFRPTKADTGLEEPGTGREAVYYLPQERDVRSVLNDVPATSDPRVTQTVFTAGATPQPKGYPVSEPV